MALVFGAANTDDVRIGGTSLDNLAAFSMLFWIYPTTIGHQRRIWTKTDLKQIEIRNSGGETNKFTVYFARDTTYAVTSVANNTLVANTWQCIGVTYDSTDGIRVFVGSLTSPIAEVTYTTQDVGSGANTDDSTNDIALGNLGPSGTSSFQGRMEVYKHFNTRMTLAELRRHQFHDIPASNCLLHWRLGYSGTTTQVDWSGTGNAGTISGPTIGAGLPIPYRRHGQIYVPYAVAAATGQPTIKRWGGVPFMRLGGTTFGQGWSG